MNQGIILVVGATGMIGAPVVRQLAADGYTVRVFVRDLAKAQQQFGASVEYSVGTVEDEASLRKALQGCTGVHISLQGRTPEEFEIVEHQGTARIARLAAGADVQRLTYVSGALVNEETVHVPQQRAKYLAEQAIEASGVPFTIFKPTYFMETLPLSIQGKRATVMGRAETTFRFVAADDFARMVSQAYRTPSAANQRLFVYGPQAMSMEQAMQTYCRIAAPDTQISVTPFAMMSLIDRLFMGRKLRPVIEINRLNQQLGEMGDPSLTNELLGAPTTTLETWSQQYAQQNLKVSA